MRAGAQSGRSRREESVIVVETDAVLETASVYAGTNKPRPI